MATPVSEYNDLQELMVQQRDRIESFPSDEANFQAQVDKWQALLDAHRQQESEDSPGIKTNAGLFRVMLKVPVGDVEAADIVAKVNTWIEKNVKDSGTDKLTNSLLRYAEARP